MGAYPNVYSGYQKCESAEAREKMEKAWGVTAFPTGMGNSDRTDQPVRRSHQGHVHLCLNPAVSYPDSNHVKRSLR